MIGRWNRITFAFAFAAMTAASGFMLVAPTPARAQEEKPKSAEELLKAITDVVMPKVDASKLSDEAYKREYIAEMTKARGERAQRILDLYKAHPKHKQIPTLLMQRWNLLPAPRGEAGKALIQEIDEAIAKTGDEKLKIDGGFIKVRVVMLNNEDNADLILNAVEEFAALAPKDPRVGSMLMQAARSIEDKEKKAALEDRIIKDFPRFASSILASRRQQEAVGKPFELEFEEAVTGEKISMEKLKGKVVVIDFWATWCGPCVAEMPTMKKLYAEYKDKGVEFIGVSLDQPEETGKGLTKLKEFVKKQEITWPQYYQGNYWQSEFSSGWGVNSIPCVFIVAPNGKLYSTEARGKLEKMIPELLKQRTP